MKTTKTPANRPKTLLKHNFLSNPTSPTALKPLIYGLSHYQKSCTRTEMPSKYKIVSIPKVKIEDVFLNRAQTSPAARVETAPSYTSPKASERSFYYSKDNEILSVDEFLQVHRKLSIFREKSDKALVKTKLDDKANKLEEARSASRNLSQIIYLDDRNENSVFMRERCLSARPPAVNMASNEENISASQSKPHSRRGISAIPQRMINREIMSPNALHRSTVSQTLKIKIPNRPMTVLTEGNVSSRGQGKGKSMVYEQKFTAKEINKHAFYMAVSPKRPKLFPMAKTKELNYCKMFGSPLVLDLAVEACIKKGRRIESARNLKTEPDRKNELGYLSSRSHIKDEDLGAMNTCMSTFVTQTSPQYKTVGENPLGRRIQERIKSIDTELNKSGVMTILNTDRTERKGENGKKRSLKKSQPMVRTKNKLPLRSSLHNINHMNQIIKEHQVLSEKIKKISEGYRKEYGASSVNSQTYVSYFH